MVSRITGVRGARAIAIESAVVTGGRGSVRVIATSTVSIRAGDAARSSPRTTTESGRAALVRPSCCLRSLRCSLR